MGVPEGPVTGVPVRFNPPPAWPGPPEGWTPPAGWTPDPTWPPAPAGWRFWVPVQPRTGAHRAVVVAVVTIAACVVLAAVAIGARGQDPGPAVPTAGSLRDWARAETPVVRQIEGDIEALTRAGAARDLGSLAAACQNLQSDVRTAQGAPPAPDPDVEAAWTTALALYARAASSCRRGAATRDAQQLQAAAQALEQARPSIDEVVRRIG